MAIHGYLWFSGVICSYQWLWLSMVIHGYLWLSGVMCGYLWLYMVINGYPWLSMVIRGYLWLSVVIKLNGYLWLSNWMVICGLAAYIQSKTLCMNLIFVHAYLTVSSAFYNLLQMRSFSNIVAIGTAKITRILAQRMVTRPTHESWPNYQQRTRSLNWTWL